MRKDVNPLLKSTIEGKPNVAKAGKIDFVYLAIVASLLCFILWNWVLPRLGVVKATNIIYTQCVFTMIISVMVLNERITWMAIAGTAILIFGMLMLNRGDKKVRID